MACAKCEAARRALAASARQAVGGNLKQAASSLREAVRHAAESDRVRKITMRKPNG